MLFRGFPPTEHSKNRPNGGSADARRGVDSELASRAARGCRGDEDGRLRHTTHDRGQTNIDRANETERPRPANETERTIGADETERTIGANETERTIGANETERTIGANETERTIGRAAVFAGVSLSHWVVSFIERARANAAAAAVSSRRRRDRRPAAAATFARRRLAWNEPHHRARRDQPVM